MKKGLYFILLVALISLACGGSINNAVNNLEEAVATLEDISTEAAEVVATSIPTETLVPTETSIPFTPTISPTPGPIFVVSGSGDDIVDIVKADEPAIVHIVGNASSRHFAVKNYGEGNESLDLLVNTTDTYDGWRPLDFLVGEHTVLFEITASGEWTLEVWPLIDAVKLSVPGILEGEGDMVFILVGDPSRAHINGNASGHHFAVKSYGDRSDLLVNTTDPYDGNVLLDPDAFVIEITADGAWSFDAQ